MPKKKIDLYAVPSESGGTYPDIDMIADSKGYLHRDVTPYPKTK
jgi:hypothetical protein